MLRATTAKRDGDDGADDDALVIFSARWLFAPWATSLSVGGFGERRWLGFSIPYAALRAPARGRYVMRVCFRSLRLADGCLEAPSVVYTL